MPVKAELDTTDRRILRILAQDGRASYQAIAETLGVLCKEQEDTSTRTRANSSRKLLAHVRR